MQTSRTIQQMLTSSIRILAAVSGGVDSVSLLHWLVEQSKSLGFDIVCAHINHHLRGAESDTDEQFVRQLAGQYGIAFYSTSVDVRAEAKARRLSIETAARQLRLSALEEIARETGCGTIATAHHKNDQAETILLRLLRGTAFTGLAGIRPVTERKGLRWIRPLLDTSRAEIETYCKTNHLTWRDDLSNLSTDFKRNWVRHRLLPHLQQTSKQNLVAMLSSLGASACRLQEGLEQAAAQTEHKALIRRQPEQIALDSEVLASAGPFAAGQIVRNVYSALQCGQRDLTEWHYQQVFEMLGNPERRPIELPDGCRVERHAAQIHFIKTHGDHNQPDNESVALVPGQPVTFGDWTIRAEVMEARPDLIARFMTCDEPQSQSFDLEQIHLPLVVRQRQTGDRFVPYGMKTHKRVSKFLTDSQLPKPSRQEAFVIADAADILWLAPVRRAAKAAISLKTRQILILTANLK